MADRPPVSALAYLGAGTTVASRAVATLVRIYPRTTSYRALADAVYALDPNGGPGNAENTIAASLSRAKAKIERAGWRVGSRRFGDKTGIGLWPVR